jgi:hypothetical protein
MSAASAGSTDHVPAHGVLTLEDPRGRARSVLCAEAHWSRVVPRRRLRFLWWLVRLLPVLLFLMVLPDRRDEGALPEEDDARPRRILRLTLTPTLAQPFVLSLFRAGWRLMLVVVVIGVAYAVRPLGLLLLGLLLVLSVARSRNILGDVQIAASGLQDTEVVVRRIRQALEWLGQRADEIVVVGHSQGGYLSHLALSRAPASRPRRRRDIRPAGTVKRLIGVGSGLKPIWILQRFDRPPLVAAAWLTLLSTVLTGLAVAPGIRALLAFVSATLTDMARAGADLGAPADVLARQRESDLLISMSSETSRYLRETWLPWHEVGFPAFALLIGSAFVLSFIARRLISGTDITHELASLVTRPLQGRWLELSSPHDLVGRLLFPSLPNAEERLVPALGNPLLDHTSYFHHGSPALWEIAHELTLIVNGDLARQASQRIEGQERFLVGRHSRRRRLSAVLTALIALAFLAETVNLNRRGLAAFSQLGQSLWVLVAWLAGLHLLMLTLSLLERRAVGRNISGAAARRAVRVFTKDVSQTAVASRYVLGAALAVSLLVVNGAYYSLRAEYADVVDQSTLARLGPLSLMLFVLTVRAASGYPVRWWTVLICLWGVALVIFVAVTGPSRADAVEPGAVPGLPLAWFLLLWAPALALLAALVPRTSFVTGKKQSSAGRVWKGTAAFAVRGWRVVRAF